MLHKETTKLKSTLEKRLRVVCNEYKFSKGDVDGIQIIFYKIEYTDVAIKKRKFSATSLGDDKDLLNVSKVQSDFNILPLSLDSNTFGEQLEKKFSNNVVDNIVLTDGCNLDVTNLVNRYSKNKIDRFSKDVDFYQKKIDNSNVIIASNKTNDTNITDIYEVSGMKISHIEDNILYTDKRDTTNFSRKVSNDTSHINDTGVYKKEIAVKLKPVYPKPLSKLKLDILNKRGNIYYSDTDSIVTDIELPESLISNTELGKIKLEHKIAKGIFISGKTYCMINVKGEYINMAKGIKANSLSYNNYVDLLNKKDINTAIKSESKVDWQVGHVIIRDKVVTIRNDSYIKRHNVLDDNGKWIDTKPLYINIIDNDFVLCEPIDSNDIQDKTVDTTALCVNNLDKSLCVSVIHYRCVSVIPYLSPLLGLIIWKGINNNDKLKSSWKSVLLYLLILFIIPVSYVASTLLMDAEDNGFDVEVNNTLGFQQDDNKSNSVTNLIIYKLRRYRWQYRDIKY